MIDKMGDRLKYYDGIEAGRVLIPHLPMSSLTFWYQFVEWDVKQSNGLKTITNPV